MTRSSPHCRALRRKGSPTFDAGARPKPILVMDGWEHAFMRDYQATERAKYLDAFFKNVNWEAAEKRVG